MKIAYLLSGALSALIAAPLWAASLSDELLSRMKAADVVILGEVHDNPDHHLNQHDALAALQPKAVVWEMLTREEASRISADMVHFPEQLEKALDWAHSGWPALSMYHQVFVAAPEARIYGGEVPREAALATIRSGPATVFGADAVRYGLSGPLPPDEEAAREALQFEAHCEAVPRDQMRAMVDIQRLRDAVLAREVLAAIADTGGPVAVITGNGHARTDWGIPSYLERLQPDLTVFSLGQSEGGMINGTFDAVIDSAPAEREDPCKTFEKTD